MTRPVQEPDAGKQSPDGQQAVAHDEELGPDQWREAILSTVHSNDQQGTDNS